MENQQKIQENFDPIAKLQEILKTYSKELEEIKKELEKENEIISLVVLPPRPEKEYQNMVFLNTIIDDFNISGEKLPRINQLTKKIEEINKKYKNFSISIKLASEVFNELNSGMAENYFPLISAYILFDKKKLIRAIKFGFVHKDLIKRQFDKYLMSYVLFGSVAKLQPREDSDIDYAVIIDDTDLREMSSYQAREQLTQIFYSLIPEAKRITGVEDEIHLQVYMLTDLWENIKEAHPVIVNFIRDTVVLYDNGVIIPWKRLLERGKIKPTAESIDNYFRAGEELDQQIFAKLRNLIMEDFFWASTLAAQAVIMALGYLPPYPKILPEFAKKIKEKEGFFNEEDIKYLEKIVKLRKDLEHGYKKEITGKELDELKEEFNNFFKRMKELYRDVILRFRKKELEDLYSEVINYLKLLYNLDSISLIKPLIEKGIVSHEVEDYLELLKAYEEGKLKEEDIEVAWKALRIIKRDLEKKFEEAKKEKMHKLITKGKIDDKEVIVLILEDGIAISYDGKKAKVYYKDGRIEEKLFNEVFDKVLEEAENLKEIELDYNLLNKINLKLTL
jgi:predicted nucleotidyltransferase